MAYYSNPYAGAIPAYSNNPVYPSTGMYPSYGNNMMYSRPTYTQGQQEVVQQPPLIKGRFVSSLDEVRAAQIDFDGSKTYFVCPALNTIYAKSIDMNGNSLVEVYTLNNTNTSGNTISPTENKFTELENRIKTLEELITAPNQDVLSK